MTRISKQKVTKSTNSKICTHVVNWASCLQTWKTWTPNSRVGTTVNTLVTESEADRNKSLSRIGNMNAAVFPVPVAAQPQISRPDIANFFDWYLTFCFGISKNLVEESDIQNISNVIDY